MVPSDFEGWTKEAAKHKMDSSEEKTFTFINLSHPDDLKDQDTIDHIRCSAMTNFGKMRRKRERKGPKNQIVFEVRPVNDVQSKVEVLSNEGVDTFSPLIVNPMERDILTSKSMNNRKCRLIAVWLDFNLFRLTDLVEVFRMNTGHSVFLREASLSITTRSQLSFQLMLSNAALYGHILQSGYYPVVDTTESLRLYNEALRLMNEKLRDSKQETSDGVIGSMCGFLTHDVCFFSFVYASHYPCWPPSSTYWEIPLAGTDTWTAYGRWYCLEVGSKPSQTTNFWSPFNGMYWAAH